MIREAIATPGRGPDVVATVLVGTALLVLARIAALAWLVGVVVDPRVVVLLPVLGAPLFLLRGYDVSVVHAGIEGDPGAPAFRDFPSLYVDGVKSILLSVGYALPAALVPVLGLAAITVQSARESGVPIAEAVTRPLPAGLDPTTGPDPTTGLGPIDVGSAGIEVLRSVAGEIGAVLLDPAGASIAILAIGAVTVATTCSAAAGAVYVRPAGLACFAATGRLRNGLRPRRVLRVAGTGEYAVGWILEVAVGIVGTALALALSPFLVGIAGLFLVRIVTRSLYGRGAAPALRSGADLRDEPRAGSGGESGSGPRGDSDSSAESVPRDSSAETPADSKTAVTAGETAESGRVAVEPRNGEDLPVDHDVAPALQVGRRVDPAATDERSRADGSDGPDESVDETTGGFVWGSGGTASREAKR